MDSFYSFMDENSKGWIFYFNGNRWFVLRSDLISTVFVGVVAFSSIPLAEGKLHTVATHPHHADMPLCLTPSGENRIYIMTGRGEYRLLLGFHGALSLAVSLILV